MPNRPVVVLLLLLAQLLTGCASSMNPKTLGPNPEAVTDAIAQAGESDPTPPMAQSKKQPDSPRWAYVMSSMDVVGEVLLFIPLCVAAFFVGGEVQNYNWWNVKP